MSLRTAVSVLPGGTYAATELSSATMSNTPALRCDFCMLLTVLAFGFVRVERNGLRPCMHDGEVTVLRRALRHCYDEC